MTLLQARGEVAGGGGGGDLAKWLAHWTPRVAGGGGYSELLLLHRFGISICPIYPKIIWSEGQPQKISGISRTPKKYVNSYKKQ